MPDALDALIDEALGVSPAMPVGGDPLDAMIDEALGAGGATPDVAKATPNVALPPVPGNLGQSPMGTLGYIARLGQAVAPAPRQDPSSTMAGQFVTGAADELLNLPANIARSGQAVARFANDFAGTPGSAMDTIATELGGLSQLQDVGYEGVKSATGVNAPSGTVAEAFGRGAAQVGTAAGMGFLTGGLGTPAAIGSFALTSAAPVIGQTMKDAQAELGPGGESAAATEAVTAGAVTAITSLFPGAKILARLPGGQSAMGKLSQYAAGRVSGAIVAEGGQEYVEGAIQDIVRESVRRGKPVTYEMVVDALTSEERALDLLLGGTLGGAARVPFEVAGRIGNASRQNNQGGQNSSVPRTGGSVPTGGPVVPGVNGVGRPGDAAQPATGQPAPDAVDQGDSPDPELTDEEAMRLLDGEEAAPTTDAAGIPIPRGASGFQGVTNEGTFVPPEVGGRGVVGLPAETQRSNTSETSTTIFPGSQTLSENRAQTELQAVPANTGGDILQTDNGSERSPVVKEKTDLDQPPSIQLDDRTADTAQPSTQLPQQQQSISPPLPESASQRSESDQTEFASRSSPDSILPLLSQRAGKPVTVADEKRLTGTERKIRDRAAKGFSRQIVYVDTDSDVEGAILGSTPTTIYVRRGLGAMRLAPVVAHELGHSIRRTNGELAREVEERIGRDRLLELGREQFAQQAESSVGVDGDPNEDALLDEGFARLIEKAVEGDTDLATRLVEDPGLWQRIKTWVRDSLAKAGISRGDGEAVAIARALDRVEAEVRKAREKSDADAVAWAQTAAGIKAKVKDTYSSSGSMQATQERGDNLLASSPSMSREVFDSNLDGYAHEGDVLNFSGPIPTEIKSLVGKRGILKYGFRANVKGGRAEDSFASMGEDRFMEAVKAQYEHRTGKGKITAMLEAMEPDARFIARFAELTMGKKPMPSVPLRASSLGAGDVIRVQGYPIRVVEGEGGYLELFGNGFNGISVDGLEVIPVDARDGVWKFAETEEPPADAPTQEAADLPFSAKARTIDVDGKQRPITNSNGQPIANSEEAIRAFWRWFGDSKVVDADGKPLVAYHATDASFNKFSRRKSIGGQMWFSTSRQRVESGDAGAAGRSKIMPLYVRLIKPVGWKEYEQLMVAQYERDGYDGAMLPNDDGFDGFVLDPASLKSAVKNQGTFDPANADIRFSARKLELRGEEQQGMLGFTSGGVAPKAKPEPRLTPEQRADLYPGIRQGESVRAYEKRMGTADTPMMFSARNRDIDFSDQTQAANFLRDMGITERVDDLAGKVSTTEQEIKRLDGRNTLTDPSLRHPSVRSEEAREQLREQSVEQMLNQVRLKSDDDIRPGVGGALPPGGLRTERLAFLVLGPPAAGKSGISERLADEHGAALVDNDYLKRTLPEFEGSAGFSRSLGAQLTHEEASNLYLRVEKSFAAKGDNMVIPIVGASPGSVKARIDRLRAAGYRVKMLSVSLTPEKTAVRALYRFDQTGRYIPLGYILNDVAQKPDEVYNALKESSDGYQQVSSDVPRGQAPRIIEESDSFGTVGGTTESDGRWRRVPGLQHAFLGRNEEAQPGLGGADRSGSSEVTRTGPQEPGSEGLSQPEPRFSARRQPNLNAQDQADARTVGKLSQQAAEASQNLDAEKSRRKAEVGGVRAQRDLERRAGQETQRELDRTVKLRDRREKALTDLIQQQQAANAQLSVELGDANEEITARRLAMKSMFGTIQDAQRQLRKAAATIQKATDKAKARADAEETAAKVRDAVVEIAKQLPPSIRGRMLTDVRDATDMRDLLGGEVTGTTRAGKRAVQTLGALGKAADLLIRYNGKEAWSTIEDITSRKSMASLTEERRKAITNRVAGADSLYRQTQAPLAPASRADAAEELMAIADDVRAIVHEHKLENRIIKAGRLADAEIARDDVRKAIAAAKSVLPPNPRKPQARVQPSRVRQWLHDGNYNLDTIAKVLDGNMQGGGPVHKIVVEDIRAGMDRKFEVLEAATRVADMIAQDAGFDNLAHLLELASGTIGDGTTKTVKVRLAGKDHTLTWGQLAKVASSLDDLSTLTDIKDGTPITFDDAPNATGIRLRAEDIQTIRDAMPEQLREAMAGLKKIRDRLFPVAQSAQRVVTGREAPSQPGYEPRIRNMAQSQRVTEMDPMSVGFENKLIENSGFLQTRVRDLKTPLLMGDFFADWQRSIHGMADVMHLMIPLRNAREVIMEKSVNNAIADRWGDRAVESIKDRLRTVVRPPERSNFARVANQLARNVAVSRTALAPASLAISATASIPRLWAELGTPRLIKGIKSIASTKVREDMLKASPWLRSRVTGAVSNIASTMPMLEGVVDSDWDKAANERWRATRERVKRGGKAAIRQVILAASEARKGEVREGLRQAGQVFTRSIPAITDEVRLQSWIDSKMAQIAWAAYDGDKAQAEKALRLVLPSADPLAQTGWSHELNASGFGSVLGSFRSDANAAYNHISQAWMTDPKRGIRVTSALLAGALIAAVIKGLDRELKDELEGRDQGRGVDAALLRFGQETLGAGFLTDKVFAAIDGIGGGSDTPVSGSVDQIAKSTSSIAGTIYTALTSDDQAKVEKELGTLLDDLLRLTEGAGTLMRNPIAGVTPYARALAK